MKGRLWVAIGLLLALLGSGVLVTAQDGDEADIILFVDDFQDGPAEDWQIVNTWTTQETESGSVFSAQGQGFAWVTEGLDWTDYVFRLGARLDTGSLVLSFRVTEDSRYLLHYQEEGLFLTKEYPRDTFTVLAQTVAPDLGIGHSIAIGCEGGHMQVYIDRELWIDYTDPDPLQAGTIGVGSLEDSLTAVANVLVLRLLHPLPQADVSAAAVSVPVQPDTQQPVQNIQPAGPQAEQPQPAEPPAVQPVQPAPEAPPAEQPAAPGQANLVLADVSLSNTAPQVNEAITVWATIANTGEAAADNFDLVLIPAYESSGPNNPGGLQAIPPLGPGEQVTLEAALAYSVAGQYTLRVLVTDDWYLTGSTEPGSGRTWDVPITVGGVPEPEPDQEPEPEPDVEQEQPAPQADLVILDVTTVNPDPATGYVDINISVQNVGTVDAGAFTVRWHPHGRSDEVGYSEDLGGLAVGETRVLIGSYTYGVHGEMHWRAIVDADNDIPESNEDNNVWTGTVQIAAGGQPAPQPDLVILDATTVNPDPATGYVDINISVQNVGTADAGAFTVRWHPHGRSDEVGYSEDLGGLAVGETRVLVGSYTYGVHGEMHWRAVVDADNDIPESNEDNNVWTGTVQIAPSNVQDNGGAQADQPPPAPTGCLAEALSSTEIAISWQAGDGAAGFNIYQAAASLEVSINDPDARSAVIGNLAPNTQYHFDVRAFNNAGESLVNACAVDVSTQP